MKSPPCKECIERQAECHSTCKRYSEWKTDHEAKRERINQNKHETKDFYDYKVKQIIKTKKR